MEPKPAQQYDVLSRDKDGQPILTPTTPAIDELSKQTMMARAMLENEMAAREQTCGADIREAITRISERHGCIFQLIETRINGQVAEIGFRSVAVERLKK